MSETKNQEEETRTKPIIIIHHFPIIKSTLFPSLHSSYTILDQHSDPSFPTRSKSARVLLCLGLTPVTSSVLDSYPSVECVIGSSAGFNHIDLDALHKRGIRATNAGDLFSDDVADYAVGLAIDVFRGVSVGDRFVKSGCWGGEAVREFKLGVKVIVC